MKRLIFQKENAMMAEQQSEEGQANTREELKKQKQVNEHSSSGSGRIRVRLIPIWLRIVLLLVMIVVSITSGALVGYGAIGGGKATDVFKASTWTHIRDLVEKEK
ncbi:DNA-directed RNA polymerase subunit beta [Bacillota bacterium Lsc_1132]